MPIAGIGCEFQKVTHIGPPHIWENLAEIMNVDGPSPERDTYDTTTIDTPGNYRTFIPGLKDGGEVTLEMNFEKDTYRAFKTEFDKENEEAITWYSIVFNDSSGTSKSTLYFRAMVTTLSTAVPTDDKVSSNVTLKVDGEPFFDTVADRDADATITGPTTSRLAWRGFVQDLTASRAEAVDYTLPQAFGGDGALTYRLFGTPAGLAFDAASRELSGTTTAAANSEVGLVYEVTDNSGTEIRQAIVLSITA